MKKIGLVFSGGGGKGAYEIGAWKALKEFGIDKFVNSVAGTSVGALNAALFATGNYESAEKTWRSITPEKILVWKPEIFFEKITSTSFANSEWLIERIKPYIMATAGWGWFSQDGLKTLIKNNLDYESLRKSIPVKICTTKINNYSPEYKLINDLDENEITKWLLASSAIPFVFKPIKINSENYYDGFLSDNLPISQLLSHNPDYIIAVHLTNNPLLTNINDKIGNIPIWHIIPTVEFGNTIKTSLNFTPDNISLLIDSGYNETCKILQNFYEVSLLEIGLKIKTDLISEQDTSFKQLIIRNKTLRKKLNNNTSLTNYPPVNSLEFLLSENFQSDNRISLIKSKNDYQINELENRIINKSINEIIEKYKT